MYDISIFYWLYGLWQGNSAVAFVVRFLAIYLPWLSVFGLLFWYAYKKEWRLLLTLGVISGFSTFVMEILKWFIDKPRPYVLYTHINPLFTPGGNLAMPSAHALVFSALATFVFFKNRRLGLVLYLVVFLISIARVSAGVHWPSDVFVGFLVGLGIGFVANLLENRIPFLSGLGKPSHQ